MRPILCATFFIFCWLSVSLAIAKESDPPYEEWISKLKIKQDPLNKNFLDVWQDLMALDSLEFCHVFTTLLSKTPSRPKQLQVKLWRLEGMVQINNIVVPDCPALRDPEQLFNAALNLSYELEDDVLTLSVYDNMVAYYTENSKFGQGVLYGLLGKELFESLGKDKAPQISSLLHNLAFNLYRSREYRAAIDVILKMAGPVRNEYLRREDTMVNIFTMFSLNTLGLAYIHLEKPDSAFMAFDRAIAIAYEEDMPFWVSLIKGNKGDAYFQQEKYDSAEVLLRLDYEESLKAMEYDNAGNSLQWLARIDLEHNKPDAALQKTREAERLISISYQPDYMAKVLFTYTKVFASLGKADSVSIYLDKFLTLHDSIEQEASDARAEIIQLRLVSQENIHKIESLNKDKSRIKLVRNLVFALIFMFAVVGFMILNRQMLKLKMRRQEALEAKNIAEQDALSAKEQLNNFTRTLIERTASIEMLRAQLKEKEVSEEQSQHIAELSEHAILTDEDWDKFKILFENVYPHFFQTLKRKTEGITIAEQRMASLIKLRLSAKKSAIILGISQNSVHKTRQRLRHRLGLSTDGELDAYFS